MRAQGAQTIISLVQRATLLIRNLWLWRNCNEPVFFFLNWIFVLRFILDRLGCIVSFIFIALYSRVLSFKIFFPPFYGHLFLFVSHLSIQLKWLLVICIAFYRISIGYWIENNYICYFKIIAKRKTLAKPTNIYWISKRFYCIRFASDAQIDSIYYTPWPNILIYSMCVMCNTLHYTTITTL